MTYFPTNKQIEEAYIRHRKQFEVCPTCESKYTLGSTEAEVTIGKKLYVVTYHKLECPKCGRVFLVEDKKRLKSEGIRSTSEN